MTQNATRVATYLPVVVLIVFALLQIDRAFRHDQTPWNGGGYGMFSSNDRISLRRLRYIALRGDEEIPLRVHSRFEPIAKGVKSYPSEARLTDFARTLAELDAAAELDGVRVEVWRTRFDSDSATASLEFVRAATYRRGDR